MRRCIGVMSGALVAAFVICGITVTVSAQGLPSQKVLTYDVALFIAQEALNACRAQNFRASVAVLDHTNTLKVFLRDDGIGLGTVQLSQMKAYTVMMNGRASGAAGRGAGPAGNPPAAGAAGGNQPAPAAPAANQPPAAPQPAVIPGTLNALGGVPIRVGDQLIGAVSVSGSGGPERDAACATAGVEKAADRLR